MVSGFKSIPDMDDDFWLIMTAGMSTWPTVTQQGTECNMCTVSPHRPKGCF